MFRLLLVLLPDSVKLSPPPVLPLLLTTLPVSTEPSCRIREFAPPDN